MRSENLKLLRSYFQRYTETRPSHPVLIEAACDCSLPTLGLVGLAQEFVIDERENSQVSESTQEIATPAWTRRDEVNFPLLILQQRVNHETIEVAFNLLLLPEPEGRQLGVQVLRELRSLDVAPHAHSQEIVTHIQRMIVVEKDELVLAWALSAIGWQCLPEGTEVLLPYISHRNKSIRHVVADNILMGVNDCSEISQPILDGVVELIQDDCPGVQWAILYEIAEQPALFTSNAEMIKQAALVASFGGTERVNEEARRALLAL